MNAAWILSLSLLAGAPSGVASNRWGCCECGAHTDAVFAVERGGLRRVYRSIANSN
jgi:hypothetical protein